MKKYYLILLLVALLLGSTYTVLKYSVELISPYSIVFYRFLLASLVMLGIIKIKQQKLCEQEEVKHAIVLGLLLSGIYLSETIGLQWTSASNAGFISDSTAIFVVGFGYLFFKEKINAKIILGIISVFIGMYFLIFTEGIKIYIGDFLILLAPIFGSLHVLYTSKISKKVNIYRLLFYQFLIVSIISLAISLYLNVDLNIKSNQIIFLLVYLGIVVTSYRYFAEIYAMKKISPVNVSLIILMSPIWAMIFAFLLLGERLILQQYIGAGLILIGLAYTQITNK